MDRTGRQEAAAPRQVVVVGGGLAGLAAACTLADQDIRVTLLEKRPFLGGKVYSFRDAGFGDIDNGQHVFLKCCTYYIAFLKKLGVLERTSVQSRLSVPVMGADGRRADLARRGLKPPFHLLPSLARYRHLSVTERLAVLRPMLAMRGMKPPERAALDHMTFQEWLKQHGQSDRAIDLFWDLILLPVLNDRSPRVSAAQAIMVFQEAFLNKADAADLCMSTVGLSNLCYGEARAYIEKRGGRIVTGQAVRHLHQGGLGIASAHTYGGETFEADIFVLAAPPREMLAVLPPAVSGNAFFYRATNLKASSIMNLHLWFDRVVTRMPFAAYLASKVQWVFASPGEGQAAQHVIISVSGAHDYVRMPKAALFDLLLEDLKKRIPETKEARVLHHALVWEREATFSAEPGSASWRLPAKTPIRNLFLAGAWTDTGWPATMESAVRSGVFAAQEVAKSPWTTR